MGRSSLLVDIIEISRGDLLAPGGRNGSGLGVTNIRKPLGWQTHGIGLLTLCTRAETEGPAAGSTAAAEHMSTPDWRRSLSLVTVMRRPSTGSWTPWGLLLGARGTEEGPPLSLGLC